MRKGLLDYVIAPPTRADESYWLTATLTYS